MLKIKVNPVSGATGVLLLVVFCRLGYNGICSLLIHAQETVNSKASEHIWPSLCNSCANRSEQCLSSATFFAKLNVVGLILAQSSVYIVLLNRSHYRLDVSITLLYFHTGVKNKIYIHLQIDLHKSEYYFYGMMI